MKPQILIGLLILAGLATGAQATMYKWVDENGVTVYSQTPPATGKSTEVKPPPPPAESPETARQRLNQRLQKLEDAAEDRELVETKQNEQEKRSDVFKANCSAAQNNLRNLEGNPRKLVGRPDGSYVRLDEEERQELLQKSREQVEKFCK